jgi:8-oxo-dGTP pyrophosphatase MutT (NUDIX family)
MTETNPIKPASTIVLLREAEGAPEIYMVKRASQAAFFGGAYVFPGGKVDKVDSTPEMLDRVRGVTPDTATRMQTEATVSAALCVAALRETFEEANILIAVERDGSPLNLQDEARRASLSAARKKLIAGEANTFLTVLSALDLYLDIAQIVFFARWVTPEAEPRRFEASFFLAQTPNDQVAAHDEAETTAGLWLSAAQILQKHKEGEIFLAPPTFRTLENFTHFTSVPTLLAHHKSNPAPIVRPYLRFGDDSEVQLLLDHDPEHPNPSDGPFVEGNSRIVLHEGRWWSKGQST